LPPPLDRKPMNVLVATPARESTPGELLEISAGIYEELTWPERERALYLNEYPAAEAKYANNARARNELIEGHLRPRHTHILWLDVDLVEVPADIVELLAEVSERDIVAPLVLIERNLRFPPDRFYDIGGFVQDGKRFELYPPYCEGGDLVDVDSVGSCYLIPAEVYRARGRYAPIGDEVEHVSLMGQARGMGLRVYARRDVVVRHAYLPRFGLSWNG